jgi:TolB-like protein
MRLSALTSALGRLVSELQRRKVLRIAAAYVVGAWIVLQVAVTLQTAMTLSASFSAAILALLVIGLPLAATLAWFFEITPEGIKRTAPATGDLAPFKPQTTDLILAGALGLVLVFAVVQLATSSTLETATIAEAPTKPKREPPRLGDKSIAVLPFANLSKKDDDTVFADGLTEQVQDVLAHVKGLRVISRTSSFAFKGKDTPIPNIAEQLGVRHILEGSIRRDGETIRIAAQLIDVTTDTHLWSQTFERKADDVLAAQDEIARAVGLALNLEINAARTPHDAPTKNLEAYRLYLKAKGNYFELTRASLRESVDLFKSAIALDPNFADAYAQLAWVCATTKTADPVLWRESQSKSRELADRALALNPDLATAHVVLGFAALRKRDRETGKIHLERAFELEPTNSLVLLTRGLWQFSAGHLEQGTRTVEALSQTDPLFSGGEVTLMNFAYARGDDAAVLAAAAKLRGKKGFPGLAAGFYSAVIAREAGDVKKTEEIIRRLAPIFPSKGLLEAIVAAAKSRTKQSEAIKKIDEETARNADFDPLHLLLLIGAHDHLLDVANAHLARNDDRFDGIMFVMWRLVARGESANPRLKTFLRNFGLVGHWKKYGWPDRCRPEGEDDFECT